MEGALASVGSGLECVTEFEKNFPEDLVKKVFQHIYKSSQWQQKEIFYDWVYEARAARVRCRWHQVYEAISSKKKATICRWYKLYEHLKKKETTEKTVMDSKTQ
ncbi:hypothetical protein L596_005861 [Steinernema carpocapsae]|uniref:Uncharacterized protein n=1 Tax=Steinernema carpocapsae TaxID=34508 RepID=A0A4V6I8S4_STECR|nr:hypothetical protein L596_005861 [Steinernema carpocapsae]